VLVEAPHRLTTKLAPEHKALQEEVRHCEVLYSDETSWYVGIPDTPSGASPTRN
jgi:hypothetical protein